MGFYDDAKKFIEDISKNPIKACVRIFIIVLALFFGTVITKLAENFVGSTKQSPAETTSAKPQSPESPSRNESNLSPPRHDTPSRQREKPSPSKRPNSPSTSSPQRSPPQGAVSLGIPFAIESSAKTVITKDSLKQAEKHYKDVTDSNKPITPYPDGKLVKNPDGSYSQKPE